MSAITKEFTKEQLQQIEAAAKEVLWPVVWSEKKAREHFSEKITPKVVLKLARIALASLEAEPVCVIDQSNLDYLKSGSDADVWPASRAEMGDVLLYRSATPVPVSVPAAMEMDDDFDSAFEHGKAVGWNAYRAAMLQGAEPVTTAYKLPDDFDFDRFNDVVWLEAVASNPHMHSLTTSTIAMVALELNRKLAGCNSPVIPDEVLSAIRKVARIRADFDDFDGDRRGIGDCLDEAEQELIVTINKHASVIAAAPQQEVKP